MDIKPQIGIRVDPDDPETTAALSRLAVRLGLPKPTLVIGDCDFFFTMSRGRLELHRRGIRTTAEPALYVDFLTGTPSYRYRNNRTIKQPLAKAAGIRQGYRPTILDATAGFGEDAFVLASLGCTVTMLERSPLIWALLDDGISRSRAHPEIGTIFVDRVKLHRSDGVAFMSDHSQSFDTVFLDPMYPHRTKSSLNKQKMRLLRELVGDDADSGQLLHAALHTAAKRVVVKRPVRAEVLDARKPSFSITSRSSRYDIYLIPYL